MRIGHMMLFAALGVGAFAVGALLYAVTHG